MAFPTIPTVAAGRVAGLNQLNLTATLTGPNLNTLTGRAAGDLVIAIAGEYQSNAGADAAFTGWAGGGLTWTEVRDSTGTTNNRLGVAIARLITGSETGAVTVTRSGTLVGDASMILLCIPGAHDTTNPEATVMATAINGAAVPVSLSPSWGAEDTLWVGVNGNGMTSGTGSWTANNSAPTNYTDFFGTNPADTSTIGDFGAAVAFRQVNAASEAFDGFGQDTNNARSSALLIAVRPAAAAPTTWELASTGTGISDGTAVLLSTLVMASIGTGVSDGAAPLISTLALASTGTGASTGTANLIIATGGTTHALSATGIGASDGTAALTATNTLASTGSGASTGTAALTERLALASIGTGTSTGTADLTIVPTGPTTWSLSATGAGTTEGLAALAEQMALAALGVGTTTGVAALTITGPGGPVTTGSGHATLTPTASATVTVTGTLRTIALTPTAMGSITLTVIHTIAAATATARGTSHVD